METNILDTIFNFNSSLSKIMPLAAIWLNKPVQAGSARTVRIEAGDKIRIEDNAIVDISEGIPATHRVTGCFGNITNSILFFELEDLRTNDYLKLNVK